MKILIDFDGTIVDVWKRYYEVFKISSGISNIELWQYKQLKKQGFNDRDILTMYNNNDYNKFKKIKKSLIEKKELLMLDSLIVSVNRLKDYILNNNAFILTKRMFPENYYDQINWLDLSFLFNRTIFIDTNILKKDWIRDNCYSQDQVLMIGDSEEEIKATELNNCNVIFVQSGLGYLKDEYRNNRNLRVVGSLSDILIN